MGAQDSKAQEVTQYFTRPSPDGVPILDMISSGIPGEAGDIALYQGRLDAQYGIYRPHLFGNGGSGFPRNVYDQGYAEGERDVAAGRAPLREAPLEALRGPNPGGGWFRPGSLMATPTPSSDRRTRRQILRDQVTEMARYRSMGIF